MQSSKKKLNIGIILAILSIVLLVMCILSLGIGKYDGLTFSETFDIVFRAITNQVQIADSRKVSVVLTLRMPRILSSVLVGAALSIAGVAYQGIFKNPLVSPDFLGVSSGACIGASLAILLGFTSSLISLLAFVGGIVAVIITASLPLAFKNRSNIMLVLSGIIVGSLMSSILGFIKFIADPSDELAAITYWTMGQFQYIDYKELLVACIVIIPPMIVIILMSWWLDVLSMGEVEAKSLGANVKVIKGIIIACSTLLTAGSVCISGTIGWVGLIIPHFSRMLVGSSNKKLVPVSILLGGIFMLLVDTLTRVIGVNEMPVSIMTGIIGVPVFIILMIKGRSKIK